MHYDGKLVKKIVNYIHTDGKVHEEPLLVINKEFFQTKREENEYEDSFSDISPADLLFTCSGFRESVNHLHFAGSHISQSNFHMQAGSYVLESNSNEAEFHYFDKGNYLAEKDGIKRKPVDFYFSMTTMPYSEAKKKEPKLSELTPNAGWSYQGVEFGEDVFEYQKAAEESLNRQLDFKG